MPGRPKISLARQAVLKRMQQDNRERLGRVVEAGGEADDEGAATKATSKRSKGPKRPSQLALLRAELQDTQSRLAQTETELQDMVTELEAAQDAIRKLEHQTESIRAKLYESSTHLDSLSSQLAESADTVRKTSAQVTRLKRGRTMAQGVSKAAQTHANAQISHQQVVLEAERARNASLDAQIAQARRDQQDLRKAYEKARREREMYKKRAERAQPVLKATQKALKTLQVWNPMDGNMYSANARRLFRRLDAAGVSSKRMPAVLSVVFSELGIKMKRKPSPRLIRMVVKEAGFLSKVQLGLEVASAKGAN